MYFMIQSQASRPDPESFDRAFRLPVSIIGQAWVGMKLKEIKTDPQKDTGIDRWSTGITIFWLNHFNKTNSVCCITFYKVINNPKIDISNVRYISSFLIPLRMKIFRDSITFALFILLFSKDQTRNKDPQVPSVKCAGDNHT